MRLGLYGGTFDPVHNAHLAVARAAADAFGLDKLLLIPNRQPPHKQSLTDAPYEHRLRMVELACREDARFEACDIENRDGKSYTIQTLLHLRDKYDAATRFYFLIGADAFAEVLTWYRVEEVFQMTEFIVAARPGFDYTTPAGACVHRLDTIAFRESSSAIRSQIAADEPPVGLPPQVAEYIKKHGLYRKEGSVNLV